MSVKEFSTVIFFNSSLRFTALWNVLTWLEIKLMAKNLSFLRL